MLSAAEQLLIEMINRTRLDPLGEAERFGIDLNEGLNAGALDGSARQVLSPNSSLQDAAEAHGEWMLAENIFSHTGAGGSSTEDRMSAAGYEFTGRYTSGENLTYQGSTGSIDLNTLMEDKHHADLFLSAGHRVNMLHDFYKEIGVSQTLGVFTSGSNNFNTSMVVEDFASSGNDVFLTGVTYTDSDGDDFYSIGEGRGNVQIQAAGNSTQTQTAGGYGIALSAVSDVVVSLGGIGLLVDLSGGNGKLDLVNGDDVRTSVDTILTSAAGSLTALGVGDINLTGYGGVDVLVGNKGDNILDGGAGADTVLYDLDFAAALITKGAGGITVATADLGTDTLRNIEKIVFNDRSVFFDTTAVRAVSDIKRTGDIFDGDARDDAIYADGFSAGLAPDVSAQVYRLYQATLGRTPDHKGHEAWAELLFEGGLELSDVAKRFVLSPEFKNTYGNVDTGSFVDLLYQNVLGRAADAQGRANWIDAIDDAVGMSRADAAFAFSQSREFTSNTATQTAQFTIDHTPQEWSDDVFRLYRATLDRTPQQEGFANWVDKLSTGIDFTQIVSGFVNSTEFNLIYGQLDDESFVELLYQNVLNRGADNSGRAQWIQLLVDGSSRAEVVEFFTQSREFVRNSSDAVTDWMRAQGTDDVIAAGGGNNVLSGGLMSDMFVFEANVQSTNEVLDLEVWDTLNFEGFGYANVSDARAHLSEVNGEAVFSDQGVTITFTDTSLGAINDAMFIL